METIGSLVDKISIVNLKIFHLENLKRDSKESDSVVAEATRKTNSLNTQRNALIDELDLAMNEIAKGKQQKLFGAHKMYNKT